MEEVDAWVDTVEVMVDTITTIDPTMVDTLAVAVDIDDPTVHRRGVGENRHHGPDRDLNRVHVRILGQEVVLSLVAELHVTIDEILEVPVARNRSLRVVMNRTMRNDGRDHRGLKNFAMCWSISVFVLYIDISYEFTSNVVGVVEIFLIFLLAFGGRCSNSFNESHGM